MLVATTPREGGEIGGMVTSQGNDKWIITNPHDMLFELTSTSTLTLLHLNYAEGPSTTVSCGFRSTYTAIQVLIYLFSYTFYYIYIYLYLLFFYEG